VKLLPVAERPLREALGLGPALLARAEHDRAPWMAASVVRGPVVVLGAAQRAGRVVRLDACAAAGVAVTRRATTGTAVYLGARGLVWTLALPHVAALAPDATMRTLLNRNVRGFLDGLRKAGAVAHYFGREWISVRKRPAAVMGFEVTPGGAVLLEVFAGVEAPVALPADLATEEERAVDRWVGKEPAALGEVVGGEAAEIARVVMRAVASRAGTPIEEVATIEAGAMEPVTRDGDPMPEGFAAGPGMRVPIGWIDAGAERASGRVWLGGDVLVPAHVLRAIAEGVAPIGDVPVEGATMEDLVACAATLPARPGAGPRL
jgi:hypothetical protein